VLVVVGGHSRNIGKTAVAAGLIAALPEARWTAVKITQHGHGVCANDGGDCHCAGGEDHPFALTEENAPSDSDSGRFLAAGARTAYWARTAMGQLSYAMPWFRELQGRGGNVIVESNSLLDFVVPDLYIAVLDFAVPDMKDSARRYLPRADALVIVNGGRQAPWAVPPQWIESKPRFTAEPPRWVSAPLCGFVARSLAPRLG
jgi:hypothetical protein